MTPQQLRNSILQMAIEGKLTKQLPEDGNAADLLKEIQAEKAKLIAEKKIKKEKPLPEITEDEKPFEIPENWCWCRLPEVGELSRGKSKWRPRNDQRLYINGKIPFIQTGDVAKANNYITECKTYYNEEGLKQSRLWPKGTLCLTIAANMLLLSSVVTDLLMLAVVRLPNLLAVQWQQILSFCSVWQARISSPAT